MDRRRSVPPDARRRFQLIGRIADRMAVETTAWGSKTGLSAGRFTATRRAKAFCAFRLDAPNARHGRLAGLQLQQPDRERGTESAIQVQFVDPYRGFSWLWGVRYLHLSDDLALTGSDLYTGGRETLDWQTKNDLIGGELGLQWAWGWDRFQLSTEAKVGLFANVYSQHRTNSATGVADFQSLNVSHSGTDLAALLRSPFCSVIASPRACGCGRATSITGWPAWRSPLDNLPTTIPTAASDWMGCRWVWR